MHREDAEKLLAAFVFGDLDEGSRAEVAAYLQTDDELRERAADMRMAAKVASDALLDGPEPVLDARRLKHLAKLAAQRKRRPVITMRRSALAAGIIALVALPLCFLCLSTFGGKSLRGGMSIRGGAFSLALQDEALSEKAEESLERWNSRTQQPILQKRVAPVEEEAAGAKYDVEFTGGASIQVEPQSEVAYGVDGLAARLRDGMNLVGTRAPELTLAEPILAERPAVAAKPAAPRMPAPSGEPSLDFSRAAGVAHDRIYVANGGAVESAPTVPAASTWAHSAPEGSTVAGARDGDTDSFLISEAAAKDGRVTFGRAFVAPSAEPTLTPPPTEPYYSKLKVDAGVEKSSFEGFDLDTAGAVSLVVPDEVRSSLSGTVHGMEESKNWVLKGAHSSSYRYSSAAAQNETSAAPVGGAAGLGGGGVAGPGVTLSKAESSDEYAEMPMDANVSNQRTQNEPAGKALTLTREGRQFKTEVGYPGNVAERKAQRESEVATVTTAPVNGPVGKDRGPADEAARRMAEDVKLNEAVADKEAVRADISGKASAALEEDAFAPAKRLKDTPKPDGSDLPPASRFRVMPVNPWVVTEQDRLSTFGLDVDTASYALCRRYIRGGFLPPVGAVRIEEFVNYFDYRYPQRSEPTFAVHAEGAPSPFAGEGQDLALLKIAVKARTIGRDQQKAAHLVFVVDTSASMGQADRMPLVQQALDMLIGRLSPADRVTLVTCADEARLVLECVPAGERDRIRQAVWAMQPSGTTNLLSGLQLGYAAARRAFVPGRVNHVVLCSDGVANVGETQAEAVLKAVAADRKQGITLTCVGVGYGSYNDAFLETLANQGDGSYVFLDSAEQARRVFVEQLAATLHTVAKDARIQVEFDPARVRRYRLIGYENRDIADARFRDDTVDAGEVGSGQCSTALYELELTGGAAQSGADLGTVFVRYRNADTGQIEEISSRLPSDVVRKRTVADSPCFYLAAGAARFAELLRESEHARNGNLKEVLWIVDQVAAALPLDRDVRELAALIREAENLPKAP